nr:hypothetical protein [Myxococcota bacterium]
MRCVPVVVLATALILQLLPACAERPPFAPAGRDAGPPPICEGISAAITCVRDVAWSCDESGAPSMPADCAARGER